MKQNREHNQAAQNSSHQQRPLPADAANETNQARKPLLQHPEPQQLQPPQGQASLQQAPQLLSQLPGSNPQEGQMQQPQASWPRFQRPLKQPSQLQKPQQPVPQSGLGAAQRPALAEESAPPSGAAGAAVESQGLAPRSVSLGLRALQQQLLSRRSGDGGSGSLQVRHTQDVQVCNVLQEEQQKP